MITLRLQLHVFRVEKKLVSHLLRPPGFEPGSLHADGLINDN